ncbi:hypothetical protein V1511DRAFT_506570 [Dipodascopsis uninucleata]
MQVDKASMADDTPKRRRTRLACVNCRSRKIKCNGDFPSCIYCQSMNHECVYDISSSKKRGLPTGHAHEMEIRTMLFEHILGYLFEEYSEFESMMLRQLTSSDDTSFIDSFSFSQFLGGSFIKRWHASAVSLEFDRLVEKMQQLFNSNQFKKRGNSIVQFRSDALREGRAAPTLNVSQRIQEVNNSSSSTGGKLCMSPISRIDDREASATSEGTDCSSFLSPSEGAVMDLKAGDGINKQCSSPVSPIRKVTFDLNGLYTNPKSCQMAHISISSGLNARLIEHTLTVPHNSDMFPLDEEFASTNHNIHLVAFPENVLDLIEVYFTYTHSWLPMVERYEILRLVHSSFTNAPTDYKSLVFAILALSAVTHDPTKSTLYANFSEHLLVGETVTVHTVQASLILALYHMGIGNWKRSWKVVCQGSRDAIDVCLYINAKTGSKYTEWGPVKWKERQNTWSACCLIDTLISARLGKQPTIRFSDWQLSHNAQSDGWEEWDSFNLPGNDDRPAMRVSPARCQSTFDALLRISIILNNLITTTAPFKAVQIAATPETEIHYYQSFMHDLELWKTNLPDHCKIVLNSAAPAPAPAPYVLNLQLMYHLSHMLIQLSVQSSALYTIRAERFMESARNSARILELYFPYISSLPMLEYYAFIGVRYSDLFLPMDISSINTDEARRRDGIVAILGKLGLVWPGAKICRQVLDIREARIMHEDDLVIKGHSIAASAAARESELTDSTVSITVSDKIGQDGETSEKFSEPSVVCSEDCAIGLARYEESTYMTAGVDNGDFSNFSVLDIRSSSDKTRLEQFMQNLGYVESLTNNGFDCLQKFSGQKMPNNI